jgi:hypothetical protein
VKHVARQQPQFVEVDIGDERYPPVGPIPDANTGKPAVLGSTLK